MAKTKKRIETVGIIEKVRDAADDVTDAFDGHYFTKKTIKGAGTMAVSYELVKIFYPLVVSVITNILQNPDIFPEEFKLFAVIVLTGILSGLQNWWNHRDD